MNLNVTIDTREFNAALKRVAEKSSRTFAQSCNAKGLHLASAAIRLTEKADVNKIAYELGQVATRALSRSGAKLKRPKRIFGDIDSNSLAYRIVASRMREKGESFTEDEIIKKAVQMRSARLRSVAFIRSGWIYAVRGLAKHVGYADQKHSKSDVARMRGLPKGFVVPARDSSTMVSQCTIGNSALIHHRGAGPMGVAERGLRLAMAEVISDMLTHLAKKLNPIFKEHSAR